MARIRTIKPQHTADKNLPNISLQAHLLWVLSWCFSDDEGVMENDPLLIRSNIFPRRTDIRVEQIEQWIDQLIKARYIIPFTHDGESYLLHRTFNVHQKIDRPQPSKIPENVIRRIIDECSTSVQPCIVLDSKVKDSKGKEKEITPKGVAVPPSAAPAPDNHSLFKNLVKEKKQLVNFIRENKPDFIEPYVELWNVFAEEKKLPKVSKINSTRKKKFFVRLKENGFDFIQVLKKAKDSQFLLTGKWFGFDWIIENEINYLKVIEGNYDKKPDEVNGQPSAKPASPTPVFNIGLKRDLNYLYDRYCDDENLVTVISIEEMHFKELNAAGMLACIEGDLEEIKESAVKKLNGKADEHSLTLMAKKLSVLHYFKVLKSKGNATIFRME